jgi:DNA helicase-2/ATP-dependent DNA helicase PcrA
VKSEPGLYGTRDSAFEGTRTPSNGLSQGGPGWRRFQERGPGATLIEATATTTKAGPSGFAIGERCFHQKFGMGVVRAADGDKLTIDFDKAGQKKVIAAFVQKP